MKRFPFTRQPDSMDCGPACLKMISSFYGKHLSLEMLRDYASIGKDGVSLRGISSAAEKVGMRTQGGKLTIDVLRDKAPVPCILHWEQNHFVVLYKIKKKRKKTLYHIADPSNGLLSYSEKDFIEHWISTKSLGNNKGVALLIEPTNIFFKNKEEDETLKKDRKLEFLWSYLQKYKKYFFQLIVGLLVGSFLQLIFPFLTQAIVDIGIGNRDIGFIWVILAGQSMLIIGRASIDFIRRRILLHISTRINLSLISDFFIKLMKLPMKFFDTKLLGDFLQRIEDHNRIEKFLTAQTLNLLFSFFSFIVFGIVLLVYNLNIFLVFIAGSLIYGIWILFFIKKRKILDYRIFAQQAKNRSKTYQIINGMQEIKLQGCEQQKRWEWEDTQAELFDINLESLSLQQTQEAGSILINEIKNLIITILAATSVIYGNLTLGMMLSIQYIIGQLSSPVEQIMNFIYQWQDVSISLERMSEIHNKESEDNKERNIKELPRKTGSDIHIKNMSFQYDGEHSKFVLKDINLIVPKAKVTAIVGASGSGKTTLIKLLLGNYIPTRGEITIENKPLDKFNLEWWRKQCGAVMQDGFIFSDSIAKNIAISETEDINIDRLLEAARISNIGDFIDKLPLSYNTIIGQEGQGISQGQKQRILIARAVYRNPEFFFLDEATNSLDANNEKIILDNLNKFYKGKTVIVVAHRLSTVQNADQIVVLHNGNIVEIGTHVELTKLKGKYYELVKNQLELGN